MVAAGIRPSKNILKKIFLDRGRVFKKYFKRFIFKEAQDFLRGLKKEGYILGLVTGTTQAGVAEILPKSLKTLFDCIVTGDQVKKGKPDPEPYLKAAGIIGLNPKQCLVIENAPLGVESAKRAGMFCIAITTSLPKEYLKKADLVVDELAELSVAFQGFA